MDHSDRGTLEYPSQSLECNPLQGEDISMCTIVRVVDISSRVAINGLISKTLCHRPFGHHRIQLQSL